MKGSPLCMRSASVASKLRASSAHASSVAYTIQPTGLLSMVMGGVYGAIWGAAVPEVSGGLALCMGLWFFGDEVAMPLLGMANGPAAYPPALHAYALATHIPYSLATSMTAQFLQWVVA